MSVFVWQDATPFPQLLFVAVYSNGEQEHRQVHCSGPRSTLKLAAH